MGALLALLSGGTIVLNRTLNAEAGTRLGVAQSTVFNYITGLCTSLLVLLAVREPLVWPMPGVWFLYTGGLMGVCVVMLSNYAAPHMSVFLMTLLVFVSQFAAALAIDALAGLALSPLKALGGLFVLGGLVLYVVGERRDQRNPARNEE